MIIEVIGSGCSTCKKIFELTKAIVEKDKIGAEVKYSNDVSRLIELGYMRGPVVLIDGKPVDLLSESEKDIRTMIISGAKYPRQGGCSCNCGRDC